MTTWFGVSMHLGENDGIRASIMLPDPLPNYPYWISQTFPNGLWAQTGYYPAGFFWQVWDLNIWQKIAGSPFTNIKQTKPGKHTLEISVKGKHWQFMADGKSVGNYGIGVTSGLGDMFATNENGTGLVDVVIFSDMASRVNGVWVPAPSGFCSLTGSPALNVVGHLQDSSLPSGAARIGPGPATIADGTQLW